MEEDRKRMTLSYQTKRAAHALASEVKDKEEDTKMMTELTGESDTKKVVVNHRSPMKGRSCKGYSWANTDIGEDKNKGVKAENRVRVPTREEDEEPDAETPHEGKRQQEDGSINQESGAAERTAYVTLSSRPKHSQVYVKNWYQWFFLLSDLLLLLG